MVTEIILARLRPPNNDSFLQGQLPLPSVSSFLLAFVFGGLPEHSQHYCRRWTTATGKTHIAHHIQRQSKESCLISADNVFAFYCLLLHTHCGHNQLYAQPTSAFVRKYFVLLQVNGEARHDIHHSWDPLMFTISLFLVTIATKDDIRQCLDC